MFDRFILFSICPRRDPFIYSLCYTRIFVQSVVSLFSLSTVHDVFRASPSPPLHIFTACTHPKRSYDIAQRGRGEYGRIYIVRPRLPNPCRVTHRARSLSDGRTRAESVFIPRRPGRCLHHDRYLGGAPRPIRNSFTTDHSRAARLSVSPSGGLYDGGRRLCPPSPSQRRRRTSATDPTRAQTGRIGFSIHARPTTPGRVLPHLRRRRQKDSRERQNSAGFGIPFRSVLTSAASDTYGFQNGGVVRRVSRRFDMLSTMVNDVYFLIFLNFF